jgi:hypothetical protein
MLDVRGSWHLPALWIGGLLLCFLFSCETRVPVEQLPAHAFRNIYPIRLGNQLLLSSNCQGQSCLLAIDVHTREVQWRWLDTKNELASAYHGLQPYVTDSLLVLPFRQSLKVFRWPEGKLVYDIPFGQDQLEPYLSGVRQCVFFVLYSTTDYKNQYATIAELNLYTGQYRELHRRSINPGQVLKIMPPWQADESDSCIVYSTLSYSKETGGVSYLHRYCPQAGIQDSLLVYPVNPLGYGIARPFLADASTTYSYWQITDGLLKLDGAAFEIVWQTPLHAGILTSEIFDLDELLVYPSESLQFYLVDKQTGEITDTLLHTPGTPGRLFKSKQHILFASGSDGLLYRWDSSQSDSLQAPPPLLPSMQRILYADDNLLVLLSEQYWHFYAY